MPKEAALPKVVMFVEVRANVAANTDVLNAVAGIKPLAALVDEYVGGWIRASRHPNDSLDPWFKRRDSDYHQAPVASSLAPIWHGGYLASTVIMAQLGAPIVSQGTVPIAKPRGLPPDISLGVRS